MNIVSVNGKNWIFKKIDFSDIKVYSENYSLD